MSVKMMNLAWKLPLNSSETLVVIALADASNDEGFCFPGYENLIEKTKLARATLAKTLGILEGAGLFEKKSHSNIGKGRKVNTYQLLFNESWFHVVTNPPKSTRIELIESIRSELIEKINKLRNDQKRPISSTLELRKVQGANSISSAREHEPSNNHHIEPSLNIYGEKKPVEKAVKKQSSKPPKKTTIPVDFAVSAGVLAWYQSKGYSEDISQHLEHFRDQCSAKGYVYVDFNAAFKGAIRNDWAGLRKQKNENKRGNHVSKPGISEAEWNSLDW